MYKSAILNNGNTIIVDNSYTHDNVKYFNLPTGGCIRANKVKRIIPNGKPIYSEGLAKLRSMLSRSQSNSQGTKAKKSLRGRLSAA